MTRGLRSPTSHVRDGSTSGQSSLITWTFPPDADLAQCQDLDLTTAGYIGVRGPVEPERVELRRARRRHPLGELSAVGALGSLPSLLLGLLSLTDRVGRPARVLASAAELLAL